jgi:TPP-dependent pyruvate/acetoin dehydrogenase alpha subunit
MTLKNKKITKDYLIAFEEDIANEFNNGKIKAPVHLYYGNEDSIINFFSRVNEEDWVFCSWRSHYQCLLKGVPKNLLKDEILSGKSISLCFPEYKIYSSAIVGGSLPIALGVAFGLKEQGIDQMVYCFIGDMTSETGIAHETIKFAINHSLPIHFIIEDNDLSVMTDTRKAWKIEKPSFNNFDLDYITYYKYKNKYPHAGAGKRVEF